MTAKEEQQRPANAHLLIDDEDETLREVGVEHDFELDDDGEPNDRRRDPMRQSLKG
jgi:hypothetical protein